MADADADVGNADGGQSEKENDLARNGSSLAQKADELLDDKSRPCGTSILVLLESSAFATRFSVAQFLLTSITRTRHKGNYQHHIVQHGHTHLHLVVCMTL